MDNFHFDITSQGSLLPALMIGFSQHKTATCWRVDEREGTPRLVLAWPLMEGKYSTREKMI